MRQIACILGILYFMCSMTGCTSMDKEEKGQDISFEVIDEDEIPEKMKKEIYKLKDKMFRISYEEDEWIYIGHGYGVQKMEGYKIEVDKCRASTNFVYVHTVLTGPEVEPKQKRVSYPYIVFRVRENEKKIVFLN